MLAATDVLEFPELHEESIPAFAFSSSLTRLVAAVGIKDFTLREVIAPWLIAWQLNAADGLGTCP